MNNQLKLVIDNQDDISLVADELIRLGVVGSKKPCGDKHPAWRHTSKLKDSICKIVAIQLAENRFAENNSKDKK